MLILPMVMFSSYFLIRPPSFAQLDKNTSSVDVEDEDESREKGSVSRQPKLKGSKEKADRLPSWLREKAISKLTFTNKNNITNIDHQDINMWSSKQMRRSNSTNAIIDVILVGSISRSDYMNAQQWTTRKQSVRNVFKATEKNTYRSLGSGSCQALVSSCAPSIKTQHINNNQHHRSVQYSNFSLTINTTAPISKVNDAEICLQRRFGLAMGASIRRYRKIKHALTLVSSGIRQPTNGALPDYLIITFDNAYFNTKMLKECMTCNDNARIGDSPLVYAPLVSYTDVNLNTQMIHQYMKHHNHSLTASTFDVFPYPTNHSGVVFNNKAFQMWMKEVRCYVSKNNNSSSFVPSPVTYDRRSQALEYQLCRIVKQRLSTKNTNTFESALIKTLQLSLSIQTQTNQTSTNNEFVYSKILEAKSISDLFSIYASHKQLLCKVMSIDRIPNEEEMLGYLIHRFKLSNDRLSLSSSEADNKSTCKVTSSDVECDINRTFACTNLSLQKLNNIIC